MNRTRPATSQQGFALIVISALFVAFALIATVMIERMTATQELNQQIATRAQLTRLNAALMQYALFNNNRLPCPASPATPFSNVAFGSPAGNPVGNPPVADCVTALPAGLTVLTNPALPANTDTIRGMVPVAVLAPYGIDPNDAFDAWNNRIMYTLNRQMTSNGSGVASVITLTENYNSANLRNPDFVLVSYGRDGLGAIPRNFTNVQIQCPGDGSLRSKNCDNDTNFVLMPVFTVATTTPLVYFDDILSYSTLGTGTDCPTTPLALTWTGPDGSQCSAVFTTLPKGAQSPMVSSIGPGFGAAAAICNGPTWAPPVGNCSLTTCVPNNTVTTTAGIQPGVCPSPNVAGAQVSQSITYGGSPGCNYWQWNQYTFTRTSATTAACVTVTHCDEAPPTPYINSCGVTNGPLPPVANGSCNAALLTWGAGCSASFPATSSGVATASTGNTAAGYSGAASATCTTGTWGTPAGTCAVSP